MRNTARTSPATQNRSSQLARREPVLVPASVTPSSLSSAVSGLRSTGMLGCPFHRLHAAVDGQRSHQVLREIDQIQVIPIYGDQLPASRSPGDLG